MAVLDDILAVKVDEVTMLRRPGVGELLRSRVVDAPPTRDFRAALDRVDGTVAVIAEIKRRSPSKGDLAPGLVPRRTARAYVEGGAACLSVLTDQRFFGGSVDDLQAARDAVDVPVLRKDFVIDDVQVYETRAIGADAMLLIAAAVTDDAQLADLHGLARELTLAVVVEVHDEAELDRARRAGAEIVGVNARNLSTFAEDLGVGERLAASLPRDVVAVAESAIRSAEDVARMAMAGFDAVLVGEMLVRAPDPVAAVRGLTGTKRRSRS